MLDLGGCRPGVNQSFKDRIQTAHRDVCWYSYRFDSHLILLKSFYYLLSLLSLTYILSLSPPLCFCFFQLSTGFSLRALPSFDSVTFHRGNRGCHRLSLPPSLPTSRAIMGDVVLMHFTTVDYVIFALLLVASAGIGLFYALSGGRQRTTQVRFDVEASKESFNRCSVMCCC